MSTSSDLDNLVDLVFQDVVKKFGGCPQVEGLLRCRQIQDLGKISLFSLDDGRALQLDEKEKIHLITLLGSSSECSTMTLVELMINHITTEIKQTRSKQTLAAQKAKNSRHKPLTSDTKQIPESIEVKILAKLFAILRQNTGLQILKAAADEVGKNASEEGNLELLKQNTLYLLGDKNFFASIPSLTAYLEQLKLPLASLSDAGKTSLNILIKMTKNPQFKTSLLSYYCFVFTECPFTLQTFSDVKGALRFSLELMETLSKVETKPFYIEWLQQKLQDIDQMERLYQAKGREVPQKISKEARKIFASYHDYSRHYKHNAVEKFHLLCDTMAKTSLSTDKEALNLCQNVLHMSTCYDVSEHSFNRFFEVTKSIIRLRTDGLMSRSLSALYYQSLARELNIEPKVSTNLLALQDDLKALTIPSLFALDDEERAKRAMHYFRRYSFEHFESNDAIFRRHLLQQKSSEQPFLCTDCDDLEEIRSIREQIPPHLSIFTIYQEIKSGLLQHYKPIEFTKQILALRQEIDLLLDKHKNATRDPLFSQELKNHLVERLYTTLLDCLIYGDLKEIEEGFSLPIEQIIPKELIDLLYFITEEEDKDNESTLEESTLLSLQGQEQPKFGVAATSSQLATETLPLLDDKKSHASSIKPKAASLSASASKEETMPTTISRKEIVDEVLQAKNLGRIAKLLNRFARVGLLPHEKSEGRQQGSHIQVHGITLAGHGRSADIPLKTLKSIGEQLADAVERNTPKGKESL